MNWTDDQKRVIDARDSNILVSAAAGSGKTAVLVARIMSRILDQQHPVNIDELLIVTFTKAAAGEMRDRIGKALMDEQEKQPENSHLARQSILLHNAQITTIDGFCSYILRNYAHVIGLLPGFRVAEEGEAKLLRADACAKVLEEAYAAENDEERAQFHLFVETFASDKSDAALEELILSLCRDAESSPYPGKWLEMCRDDLAADTEQDVIESIWMTEFLNDAEEKIQMVNQAAQEMLQLTEKIDGPAAYRPNAEYYAELCESLMDANGSYREIQNILQEADSQPRLSTKKDPAENPKLREKYKHIRDQKITPVLKELKEHYFKMPMERVLEFQKNSAKPLEMLIDLTERMMECYREEKQKRNLLDFSDLEHMALSVLRNADGSRTFAAKELAGRFSEVMIDEYQDSNYLQEAILTAVSRIEDGKTNYFCVGDVKQSIYSFRQARPELFMEKYEQYQKDERLGTRIDLHKNFRSSRTVVDTVNGIFSQIMRRELGGVEYDDAAALVKGAEDQELPGLETELIPVFTEEDDQETLLDDTLARSKQELEARAVGTRIRQMVGRTKIYDGRLQEVRTLEYRDIVILLRAVKGWSESFVHVLEGMRIPVYSETRQGYFAATEVETVLNYLEIADNPQQDIPMTAVLKSPFAGLNADELAKIRTNDSAASWTGNHERDAVSMYDAARAYAEDGDDPALKGRLESFFSLYDSVRAETQNTPLHELVYRIIHESGYIDYVQALPGGSQRALNLRMLIDKAADYETTSYVGLFHFVRYIHQMKEKELDFGEISAITEQENVVRIYSIHKSKGLEYPVVFLSGMSKHFNLMDLNRTVLTHPELGIASDFIDVQQRIKAPTLRKLAIRHRKKRDQIGEELRILYVALTRAKQKLILTGIMKNQEECDQMYLDLPLRERQIPVGYLLEQNQYLSWVIPAAKRMIDKAKASGAEPCIKILPYRPSELAGEEIGAQVRRAQQLQTLDTLKQNVIYDADMREIIDSRFSYQYPYAGRAEVPVEVSVSELKAEGGMERSEANAEGRHVEYLYGENTEDALVPKFLRETQQDGAENEERLTGAARGSAYHKVMELLSFSAVEAENSQNMREQLLRELEQLKTDGRITEIEQKSVSPDDILNILRDPLGMRMAKAEQAKLLWREQPFVLGVPASEIRQEWPDEEMVFVQGMIDAFFEEEDHLVLVDYKTDYVRSAEELAKRYHIQTDQYANALEKITGKKVAEIYLWSFYLQKAIPVSRVL